MKNSTRLCIIRVLSETSDDTRAVAVSRYLVPGDDNDSNDYDNDVNDDGDDVVMVML